MAFVVGGKVMKGKNSVVRKVVDSDVFIEELLSVKRFNPDKNVYAVLRSANHMQFQPISDVKEAMKNNKEKVNIFLMMEGETMECVEGWNIEIIVEDRS